MKRNKAYDLSSIGGRIAFVRGEAGQEAFAKRLGISRGTLIRYENNERIPDFELLQRIIVEYGVDPGWLMMGEDRPNPKLTPREMALLANYRACSDEEQRHAEKTCALLAQSAKIVKKIAG